MTKRSLAVHDLAILGYFSRVAGRYSARRVLDHYNTQISANHLDVDVGTGYSVVGCVGLSSGRVPELTNGDEL